LGPPNPHHSSKNELRWGTNGSKSVRLDLGVWRDYQDDVGGGTLDLVKREKKLAERAEQFKWLEDNGYLPKSNGAGGASGSADGAGAPKFLILDKYDYVDEGGELLFQVCRLHPKTFRQRKPDPNNQGEFIWSIKGVRLVPYRLPELIAAIKAGKTIYIVEGEKDADRLWSIGIAATCNPMGAGKWKPEFAQYFVGANVVVIPDNDPQKAKEDGTLEFHQDGRPKFPGQDHARAVCTALAPIAGRVRYLDLAAHWADMPPKADVSNWLDDGGGTAEKLIELAERAPESLRIVPPGPESKPKPKPKRKPKPVEKLEPGERPQIMIEPGETPRIVDEIEAALLGSRLPLYKRGGLLVSPGYSHLPTWDKKTVVAETIIERDAHTVVENGETVAEFFHEEWIQNENDDWVKVPVRCGMALRFAVTLKARKYDMKFPVLRGIANCPSISADGELLDQPGFDPKTGILYDSHGVVFPRVPDPPTKSDIAAALGRILTLFHTLDRDFVESQDKGVAVSTLMSAIARRGLDFAPLHGMDAPVAGSGKSLIIEIASILLTGHGAVVMAQGETGEEFEKRLGTILLRGDALVALDNCDHPLEGETLNQCLTQSMLQVRILGKSEMPWIQTAAFLTATGNQLQPKGDMVRRVLVGRLDPKCARPELRQYNFDPLAYAYKNRPQLVCDILTLLKGYHNAGRPNRPPPLQSFVNWSNTVRACICWLAKQYPDAKLDDPCKTMERARQTDPVLGGLQSVLAALREQFGDDPVTTAEMVRTADQIDLKAVNVPGALYPHVVRELKNSELHGALLGVAGRSGKIDVRLLGNWFNKHIDRLVLIDTGKTLKLSKHKLIHGNQQWKVVVENEGLGGSGGSGGSVSST
jgi:hypothetical protein